MKRLFDCILSGMAISVFCPIGFVLAVILRFTGEAQGEFLELANSEGIMTRPAWTPLHLLPLFYDCPKMDLTVKETMARRVVNIPSTASL